MRALQRRHDVGTRRLERRNQAEEDTRRRRAHEREPEHAPVHAEVEVERQEQILVGQQAAQPAGHPAADDQPADAAGERERQAFREQLPDDAHAARAQRQPGRDLLLAGGGPRQEQSRDIRAGDEQDDRDRRRWKVGEAAEPFLHLDVTAKTRLHAGAGIRVGTRIVTLQARRHRGEFRARLSQRHAGLQPPEHLDPRRAALAETHSGLGVGPPQRHDRHPDVVRRADLVARERFRGHADEGEVMPVEFDSGADDTGIAGKAPLPEPEAHHRERIRVPVALVGRRDQPASRRRDAEHVEVVAGHQLTLHALGLVSGAQVEGVHRRDRQAGHHRIPGAIVQVVGIRGVAQIVLVRVLPADVHQAVGLGDAGERPQQQRVHEAEDRRVRADPERQRRDGDQRERRVLEQHAESEPEVLHHFVLPSLPLEPQGVPERARAASQQLPLVTPVEAVPIEQQLFAAAQLRFPLLAPVGAQAARHDDADQRDQPEVRPGQQLPAAGNHRHRDLRYATPLALASW